MLPQIAGVAWERGCIVSELVDIPVGTAGGEHVALELLVNCVCPNVFTGFFDIKDANAAVNYGGKNGASEVGDLDFAGEEDRVVGWEGIWTF